jgi:hypothetical protein
MPRSAKRYSKPRPQHKLSRKALYFTKPVPQGTGFYLVSVSLISWNSSKVARRLSLKISPSSDRSEAKWRDLAFLCHPGPQRSGVERPCVSLSSRPQRSGVERPCVSEVLPLCVLSLDPLEFLCAHYEPKKSDRLLPLARRVPRRLCCSRRFRLDYS